MTVLIDQLSPHFYSSVVCDSETRNASDVCPARRTVFNRWRSDFGETLENSFGIRSVMRDDVAATHPASLIFDLLQSRHDRSRCDGAKQRKNGRDLWVQRACALASKLLCESNSFFLSCRLLFAWRTIFSLWPIRIR